MIDPRFANKADIPSLVELGRHMHVESRYGWMVYSADRVWKQFEDLLERKDRCVLAASSADGELSGFLVGSVHQYPFARDFVASLDYVYLRPEQRKGLIAPKLLTAFRRWATNREVAEIVFCNTFGTSDAQISKLFAKLGMPAVGGVHAAWIENRN